MHPLLYVPFSVSATALIIMFSAEGSDQTSLRVLVVTTVLGFATTLLQAFLAARKAKQQRAWDLEDHQLRLEELREQDKIERELLAEATREIVVDKITEIVDNKIYELKSDLSAKSPEAKDETK